MNSIWTSIHAWGVATAAGVAAFFGSHAPSPVPSPQAALHGSVSRNSVVVPHTALPADSEIVNIPSCGGFFDHTLLGKNGIKAAALGTSAADAPDNSFSVPEAQLGEEAGKHPTYALLRDGRIAELEAGATHQGDGCEDGLIRSLIPKEKDLTLGAGGELLLIGEAASSEHVKWFPIVGKNSEEDPIKLLQSCRGIPREAIQSKVLTIYASRAPLKGALVHFEWTPTGAKPECDGYGSLFAYLPKDGSCQVFQMSPYDCMITDQLSVMSDALGLVEFTQGGVREDILVIGVAEYESRSLISLRVSKEGKVSTNSCGALFAGGC